jgi:hypothetical protein
MSQVIGPDPGYNGGPSQVNSPGNSGPSCPGGRENRDIMVHMRYNGYDKWGPFYSKFTSIAEYQRWMETDKMFALSLVLEGTALEYYNLLKTRNSDIQFSALVQRFWPAGIAASCQSRV